MRPDSRWGSVEEILDAATDVEPLTTAGVSGARLERIHVDGTPLVVKRLDPAADWTMRALGDLSCYTVELWERGILDRLPACIAQPVVAAGPDPTRPPGSRRVALVMEDISAWLLADEDAADLRGAERAVPHSHGRAAGVLLGRRPRARRHSSHAPLPDALAVDRDRRGGAGLGARRTTADRPGLGAPRRGRTPRGRGRGPAGVGPGSVGGGAGDDAADVPARRLEAVQPRRRRRGPHHPARLGDAGAGTRDRRVAWYLAINCRRLPVSKDACIAIYRNALESSGWTPSRGGTGSSPWPCSAGSSSSGGRSAWAATTTSWPGGRRRRCEAPPSCERRRPVVRRSGRGVVDRVGPRVRRVGVRDRRTHTRRHRAERARHRRRHGRPGTAPAAAGSGRRGRGRPRRGDAPQGRVRREPRDRRRHGAAVLRRSLRPGGHRLLLQPPRPPGARPARGTPGGDVPAERLLRR